MADIALLFFEKLLCFTFIDILRHGANHVLPLVLTPGEQRVMCALSLVRRQITHVNYVLLLFFTLLVLIAPFHLSYSSVSYLVFISCLRTFLK